jgi:hypothetical protein
MGINSEHELICANLYMSEDPVNPIRLDLDTDKQRLTTNGQFRHTPSCRQNINILDLASEVGVGYEYDKE